MPEGMLRSGRANSQLMRLDDDMLDKLVQARSNPPPTV